MSKSTRNHNLNQAKINKNDEFYTSMEDINKEMLYYWPQFKDKIIYLNCDNPYESKFFLYFALQFNHLGLKKVIATCYQNERNDTPWVAELDEFYDFNKDGWESIEDAFLIMKEKGMIKPLSGNGDFRSEECLSYLKEADIIITNPPFSLFREFIDLMMKYEKQFLVIGNFNAITYKEIFPLFMNNKIWLGINSPKNFFIDYKDENTTKSSLCKWFTNLPNKRRNEELVLYKRYVKEPELYPEYDNYKAIEVSKVKEIPKDYEGIMGVPITFLDSYNPNQFEILGSRRYNKSQELLKSHKSNDMNLAIKDKKTLINGKETYDRIFIKNKHVDKTSPEIVEGLIKCVDLIIKITKKQEGK